MPASMFEPSVQSLKIIIYLIRSRLILEPQEFVALGRVLGSSSQEISVVESHNVGNEVRYSVNHEEERYVYQVFNNDTNAPIHDEEAQNLDLVSWIREEGVGRRKNNYNDTLIDTDMMFADGDEHNEALVTNPVTSTPKVVNDVGMNDVGTGPATPTPIPHQ
ncbi:hypothetical protein Tco_0590006 [Tanacetum coccineum]